MRDPIRLILFIVLVLILIGVVVNLFAPLGNYRFGRDKAMKSHHAAALALVTLD